MISERRRRSRRLEAWTQVRCSRPSFGTRVLRALLRMRAVTPRPLAATAPPVAPHPIPWHISQSRGVPSPICFPAEGRLGCPDLHFCLSSPLPPPRHFSRANSRRSSACRRRLPRNPKWSRTARGLSPPAPAVMPAALRLALAADQVRITYVGPFDLPDREPAAGPHRDRLQRLCAPAGVPDIVTMNHAHSTHYTERPDRHQVRAARLGPTRSGRPT